MLSGLKRTRSTTQRKKTALTSDLMKAVLLEVGGSSLKAKRDRAILLIGLMGALRWSEIAALDVTDLRFQKEGVVVLLRRSRRISSAKAATSRCARTPLTCSLKKAPTIGGKF